ncbi:MAG: NAD(P) transhydrogenase subunit alpha [Spirochaetales bacterium]
MSLSIGVPKETAPGERRVALIPAHVPNLTAAGFSVLFEPGAGMAAGYPDADYESKGALSASRPDLLSRADIVLSVRATDVAAQKEGQLVIGLMDPWQPNPSFDSWKAAKVTAFAMELIPRTTRAQAMDVLSSQANLAGYKGVLLAADLLPKIFPMMMTAGGTITPTKVFVLGAGVAGLQAIATAKRLGALVSAFDVRLAAKEQVESLGAKFIIFDVGDASAAGGYAKELTPEQQARQKELMAEYLGKQGIDVIVTTAAIPGRPSPKLITEAMVKSLHPGAVIVDLASERGGNCELTVPGETVERHGVTIAGPLNVPSRAATHASQLYSKNVSTFLLHLLNKEKQLEINVADDIVAATLVTWKGGPGNEKIAAALGWT